MKITIIADNRENSSGVPSLLSNNNINVQMMQLMVGDYMINDDIVIERKTKEDFVQSILDGRLFSQCAGLRKTGLTPLIIVEGNPYETRHNISAEAIKGALLSISLSWQIPVIRSSGKEDTVHLMVMAARQGKRSPAFVLKKSRKPKKKQNQQHYFLQGIPGVGAALAYKLLTHFSSIEKLILADVKELGEVEGIGKIKADKIFHFFRDNRQ